MLKLKLPKLKQSKRTEQENEPLTKEEMSFLINHLQTSLAKAKSAEALAIIAELTYKAIMDGDSEDDKKLDCFEKYKDVEKEVAYIKKAVKLLPKILNKFERMNS